MPAAKINNRPARGMPRTQQRGERSCFVFLLPKDRGAAGQRGEERGGRITERERKEMRGAEQRQEREEESREEEREERTGRS